MQNIINIKNLWFKYEESSPWVLKDIDLTIRRGEWVSIIGQNGSGKTTLVKHINGLLKPVKGDVLINGTNTKKAETWELARSVGFVFQYPDSQIFANTIFNEVSFGPRNLGFSEEEIEQVVTSSLNQVGLHKNLDTKPGSLSTGEKRRLAIADVLAMKPDIIVLDEPTTGQDESTCENLMNIVKELARSGKTIITVTHDMELTAKWSDKVILMDLGKIIKNATPRDVFTDFELLKRIEIDPPQVALLSSILNLPRTPITIDDTVELLKMWISR